MTEIREWSEVVVPAFATVAVLILALLIRARASGKPRRQLPPGPRGWPLLGSLHLLGMLPHESLFELSKRYGPIMSMRLGSVKTLVVTSPKVAQEIFKTHDKIMASRPLHIVPQQLLYNARDVAWAPYGEYWRYIRKFCNVGLLSPIRINQFQEIREREVMAVFHFILEESQRGYAVDLTECVSSMILNNVTQMMMKQSYCVPTSGTKSALRANTAADLPSLITELLFLMGSVNFADYIPLLKSIDLQGIHKRTKDLHLILDKFVEEEIEKHRQRGSTANTETYKEDFVDALLGFGQTEEFNERLSVEAVKAIILIAIIQALTEPMVSLAFLITWMAPFCEARASTKLCSTWSSTLTTFAQMQDMIIGADTSSVVLLGALSELLKNPHMLRKAQEELDSVVGRHRLVQEEDLPNLHYINAVVKETLRFHPPGPLLIPHESIEDCEIEGFHVPAGTRVLLNRWGLHRDSVWERPLEFDPDRFLTSTASDYKGQSFEFLPFGSGRRICPGMNMGYLMVAYPLSVLLHALDWTIPDGQKCAELHLPQIFGLVLYKQIPLTVLGKVRLPNDVLHLASSKGASEVANGHGNGH